MMALKHLDGVKTLAFVKPKFIHMIVLFWSFVLLLLSHLINWRQ